MSGTSLDGLDIAYCQFEKSKKWKYKIIHAETKKYNKAWKEKLSKAFWMFRAKRNFHSGSKKQDLKKTDREYGRFIGKEILKFIKRKKIAADFISSHGHTVFHQPRKKITLQIGHGEEIASICKLPVVCDFRSDDVAQGGQGAPLVPIADKMLFSKYAFCLNLGGFANVSFDNAQRERIAFDICPVNIILNDLATKLKKEFDRGGKMASQGKIHNELLKKLNALPFYKSKPPKSLGREWVEKIFLPILHSFDISIPDKLRTVVEHFAIQIASVVNPELVRRAPYGRTFLKESSEGRMGFLRRVPALPVSKDSFGAGRHSDKVALQRNLKLLVTGGGVYNDFLIGRIAIYANCGISVPEDKTIQFKEAMAFAFLGALRIRGEVNILKSVTGAKNDSSGGRIYPA